MATYPPKDAQRQAGDDLAPTPAPELAAPTPAREPTPVPARAAARPLACIAAVEPGSPFDDAGFAPGCAVAAVDGRPVRDVLDWQWLSADDVIEVSYIDLDGEEGAVTLERDEGQPWGVAFDGVVFDGVRTCRNACTFCFMRQLPPGMRPSLYLRDDDYRLSFLSGTFVTFTNLSAADEERIASMRLSPLRFSLQAASSDVRARLVGRRAAHGLAAADRLLSAGIELHAQVVLVPGENDGPELIRTLEWAYARPGVLSVGIVPLGYTRHQAVFDRSFNDASAARAVLDAVRPFQERASRERGRAWVYCADELYRNAYGEALLDNLPPASFYGDFDMFEDGIGIIRTFVDEWEAAERDGLVRAAADALRRAGAAARIVVGGAMTPFFPQLVERARVADAMRPLVVENRFFGGNVDVTGLLTGEDIARAVRGAARRAQADASPRPLFFVPRVVLNDDGLTLDDLRMEDVGKRAGVPVRVVSCSPVEYVREIADAACGLA